MDEFIALLREIKMVPTLDANFSYWQIEMDDKIC